MYTEQSNRIDELANNMNELQSDVNELKSDVNELTCNMKIMLQKLDKMTASEDRDNSSFYSAKESLVMQVYGS